MGFGVSGRSSLLICVLVDLLDKEAKWAKDKAERDAVMKEIVDKKAELNTLDVGIQ